MSAWRRWQDYATMVFGALPQVTDPEEAARIVAAAHLVCPYSNATRGNIDVRLTANGRDL